MTLPGIFLALRMSAEHDEALARRLERRDPEAMVDLYDRYGRLAYSVIVAIVRDPAVAENLLQETFLRVWNRAHAFEPGCGALGPWLLAIARNRALDRLHSRDAEVPEYPWLFVGMQREVLDADHARVVRAAIAKLGANQRKVLELAYYEGPSLMQMAERMDESPRVVETWASEAVKLLRHELGQTDGTTCGELRADYTLYAFGMVENPERADIATHVVPHLARRCPECISGMASALATVTAISGAVQLSEPPERLRRRVMAAVEKEARRSWVAIFLPWAITGAMSIALVALGVSGRRQMGDTPKLQQALSILSDPATRDVASTKGRVFVNPGKGVVFIGAGLPRIEAGMTFELWVIPAAGKPLPAGLFRSQPDDTAVFVQQGPVQNAAAIEVTVEPQGGSAQPTSAPVVLAKL
jgi:RNA polymerase sigma-70 factor, ECF subfamily